MFSLVISVILGRILNISLTVKTPLHIYSFLLCAQIRHFREVIECSALSELYFLGHHEPFRYAWDNFQEITKITEMTSFSHTRGY